MAYTLFAEKNRVAWVGVRPGVYGDQVTVDGVQNAVGTTILYTVPAGKTLLMFDSWSTIGMGVAAGQDIFFGIYNAVPALVYRFSRSVNTGAAQILSHAQSRFVPIEIAEGFSIRAVVIVSGIILCGFFGILVDPTVSV